MILQEATTLISDPYFGSLENPTSWADLGCGAGLFSLALANLLRPGSRVLGVDKKPALEPTLLSNGTEINPLKANFENDILPVKHLDGILMANSLHYVARQKLFLEKLLKRFSNYPAFIIVEYETKSANQWVPYPIDFLGLKELFSSAGYGKIKITGKHPSVYGSGYLYAALALK